LIRYSDPFIDPSAVCQFRIWPDCDRHDLGIVLRRNWNARPVAADSRTIAGASGGDCQNASRKGDCTAAVTRRIPLNTLARRAP
jgi:hypothetical protein